MKEIGRVHVLTDVVLQTRFSHQDLARLALEGGADVIQFRQKSGSTREFIETARDLNAICRGHGALFIVNDRIDVAIASGAPGVHLGQSDVQQHQVGPVADRDLERALRVGSGAGPVAGPLQVVSQAAAQQGIVIDQQDVRRRHVVSPRAPGRVRRLAAVTSARMQLY